VPVVTWMMLLARGLPHRLIAAPSLDNALLVTGVADVFDVTFELGAAYAAALPDVGVDGCSIECSLVLTHTSTYM
jgi:hypothetical protein